MESTMDNALRHARTRAEYLHKCDTAYIIQISAKELGIPSDRDGCEYVKHAVRILMDNRTLKLSNGVYIAVGLLRDPSAGEDQVEQGIRGAIQEAWEYRCQRIWDCYFTSGEAGKTRCPSNREFLMALADFVDMWKAFCQEANHGT